MKTSSIWSIGALLLATAVGLSACGGSSGNGGNNVATSPSTADDSFVSQVDAIVRTSADNTEPVAIDNIAATSPEEAEPVPII
jgi:ABC-type glycerol-3-phosphate transport system substrate-binding protein